MAGPNDALARTISKMIDQRLTRATGVKLGMVSSVNAGDTPPTLTVNGKRMPYADSIVTPVKGDVVAYLVAERFVIARRA